MSVDARPEESLTSYADPEFSLFLRKAFIKAAGYSGDVLGQGKWRRLMLVDNPQLLYWYS